MNLSKRLLAILLGIIAGLAISLPIMYLWIL